MVAGLGARRAVPLVKHFRSPAGVFRASRSELEAAGLPGSTAQTIASGCTFEDAADQLQIMQSAGADLVPFQDPRYPARLGEIYDPPLVLFTLGRVELLSRVGVAIVGTRRPTTYGVAAAERISAELAAAGLTITSGMARGIDTAAHKAALDSHGETIAVFGSGVDHIYPAENRKLADRISQDGLLVSEFPMSTPGHPQNFPIRNRIVSGLSAGVLVVEGAQYSGSAITAQLAMEQGREVFAIPGNITSKMSWGPNLLIKQGARLVQAAEDVLAALSPDDRRAVTLQRTSLFPTTATPETTPLDRQLKEALGPNASLGESILGMLRTDEAIHVDQLLESSDGWSSSEVLSTLFQLELLGLVRQMAGRNFAKVW